MPRMPLRGARVRGILLLGVLTTMATTAACSADGQSPIGLFSPSATPTATFTPAPTATPTPTQTPSPTPTPPPEVRIASADRALFNDDWDRAEIEYTRALRDAPEPNIAAAAQYGLAFTRLRRGATEQAVGDFNLYLQAYPGDARVPEAYFLLGEAHLALQDFGAAVQNYENYLELRPGVIDSYVQERIGDAYRESEDYADAARAYELAIIAERSGNLNFLLLDKADALLKAGDPVGALALYDLVDNSTQYNTTRAEMDLLRGRVYLQLGDKEKAHEYFLHSVETYPDSYNSYSAMLALLDAGVPIDDARQGLVDYNAGEYVAALEAFDRHLLANPEHSGEPHYYKALAYRALGNYGAAQDEFREVIDGHPDDPLVDSAWEELAFTQWAWGNDLAAGIRTYLEFARLAPDDSKTPTFLFQAAQLYERTGDLSRAAETFSQVADVYALSDVAPTAAFRAGITFFRQSLYSLAAENFEQAAKSELATAELRSAGYMWLGKAATLLEEPDRAAAAYQAAVAADSGGYYALRASDLAAGVAAPASPGTFSFEFDERAGQAAAEAWLAARLGIENDGALSALSPDLASDSRWIRGVTLWRLGLSEDAKNEFDNLWRDKRGDALAEYQLALAMRDLGYYYGAIWSARSSLDALGLADPLAAPAFFSYLRYGPYYADLIVPAAERYGLDPLLVYALIRQESLFQGAVVSFAYAQGLMQIIPDTGAWIASRLEWPDYQQRDLYRPFINVEFGTFYLAEQTDYFDGHMFAALAAYNAGPGNAEIWYGQADGDYDLFVELIRLDEPRRYVRRVYEHYAVYRDLYGR